MEETLPTVQEISIKRLVVGPLGVRLHSSAIHRILKMITCAMDHEYEPYCKPQQGRTSRAHRLTMRFAGLALTMMSQQTTNRSLYCHFSLTLHLSVLCLVVFCSVLFCQWPETTTNCTLYPHYIVISLHNPSFNTRLYMKCGDLLDHMREDKPDTLVSDHPCTAIDEVIPGMLWKNMECVCVSEISVAITLAFAKR